MMQSMEQMMRMILRMNRAEEVLEPSSLSFSFLDCLGLLGGIWSRASNALEMERLVLNSFRNLREVVKIQKNMKS